MERRLLLAIAAMIAVMVLANILFPPVTRPPDRDAADPAARVEGSTGRDTAARPEAAAPADTPADTPGRIGAPAVRDTPETTDTARAAAEAREIAERLARGAEGEAAGEGEAAPPSDTVVVRSPLYEYRFDTRGARMVQAWLLRYRNFTPGVPDTLPVEIVRPGDAFFGYRVAVGGDTLDLRDVVFEPSATRLEPAEEGETLEFHATFPGTPLEFRVAYRFQPDSYRVRVEGRLVGIGDRGHTVLVSLGRGLQSNEANPDEDLSQMAVVARERADGDIVSERLDEVEASAARPLEGGPFSWTASKSKYFVAALVSDEGGPGIGGVLLRGAPAEHATGMEATLPVPAGSEGFGFEAYVGPQDYERLRTVGQGFQNVNPFGYRWLQWLIRPLAGIIVAILVWMHETFALAYGWVLILFGVLTRIVLFPLYQKSMRHQMEQMRVQPLLKEVQDKYKDDPQKLQQEMIRLYKEHNINPLGGCLPMLAPFPVLITLFFVFQNTIEFRGVPFWWIPDLSLHDPIYLVPLFMGASMMGLNWIGQRGMESNTQMKVMTYVIPVVFTFLFARFAAGLNLYYAASNVASLPQQIYLARERREARAKGPPKKSERGRKKKGRRKGSDGG